MNLIGILVREEAILFNKWNLRNKRIEFKFLPEYPASMI